MKKIKFRGISKNTGELVYGYYYYCEWNNDSKHWIRVQKDNHFIDIAVRENTVGQYTGMKDKNNKELYTGDIVKVNDFFVLVRCHDDDFSWNIIIYGDFMDVSFLRGFKNFVIEGNEHKDKDLLKKIEKLEE